MAGPGRELFDLLRCQQCHVLGAIPADQPLSNLAPDLRMTHERLKPEWILDWLRNPAAHPAGHTDAPVLAAAPISQIGVPAAWR